MGGKGIVSDNSSNKFTDTNVIVDANSIGIQTMNGDTSEFSRTTVLVGQDLDIDALLARLQIPSDVPREFVTEAVDLVQKSKEAEPLRYSKLRIWLVEKGFDLKFVAETLVAFASAVLGSSGS